MSPDVLSEKSQHEVSTLLKHCVLAAIPPVSVGIAQVLGAVQLNDNTSFFTKEIHFHMPKIVEWNWQLDIQTKTLGCLWQCLQSAIKERLAGAPGASFAFVIGRRNSSCVNE